MADLLGLGTVNEILLQPPHHLLHVGMERLLGTIVVDQVFDDIARELVHAGIDGQGLVDDLALEHVFEFLIHAMPSCCSKKFTFSKASR